MRALLKSSLLAFLSVLLASAQQFSAVPQSYFAATKIAAGTPVNTTTCGLYRACVTPTTASGGAAGITLTSADARQPIMVAQLGNVLCGFATQPVVGHTAAVGPGVCVDTTMSLSEQYNDQGIFGMILQISNADGSPLDCTATSQPYCAYINNIHPGAFGRNIRVATIEQDALSAFVKAHQLTSAGAQGAPGTPGKDGATGQPGPAPTLSLGPTSTLAAGSQAAATISGGNGAYTLAFSLPTGATGLAGKDGVNGLNGTNGSNGTNGKDGVSPPAPVFNATATGVGAGNAPTAAITGTYPNLTLALGLPAGFQGVPGVNGKDGSAGSPGQNAATPAFTASASSLASGTTPTVALSGAYPNLALAFGVPAGAQGLPGVNGSNGKDGAPGTPGQNATNPSFTASAAPLAAGSSPTASVSGTYPALTLSLGIPAGQAGTNGTNGANAANPSFTTSASALAPGSTPTVALSGSYPNLALAFGLPSGVAGTNGTNGANAPSPVFSAAATGLPAGANPTASLSGTYPSQALTFGIPAGQPGTSASVTVGTVTNLACSAAPTVTNSGTSLAAVLNFGLPLCKDLTGTTAAIGGTLIAVGGYASGTATITGAVVGKPCFASPADGVKVAGITIDCAVTAANTATVYLTGIIAVAPAAKTYSVAVVP